ncbi:TraB/GumN family protein [Sporosalibacterium faouarense]|uniref:TraB/GumN family protein n=1 Tax=Sporosalibacterium faouarense TaxID=516123 RepID=UPI00141CC7A6|nr:TraB/GumN family protein [Sporosalibacterium faouarense]MTI48756.1 TraB/GumN family protein [Bacillota bacterium]
MEDQNIHRVHIEDKEIILIGTAHVSKKSAEQVKQVIEEEQPDSVCIELDKQRYKSIREGQKWKDMDIFKVVKENKALLLLVNLVMSSFQKRMAKQFGINPGQEMIQGIQSAEDIDANLVLADRDINITFTRVWRGINFWGKIKLFFELFFSIFSDEEITEEELEKLKTEDMLTSMLSELGDSFPKLKNALIDERDKYLSHKIKTAPGKKIVAVLGAGHVPGIKEEILKDQNLGDLTKVPPKSKVGKIIGWMIPIIILSIIGYTFYTNRNTGIDQTISWVLWNGSLSSLGALIALGHPLSILTAFVVSPISSLNPALAAGWFSGIVEAFIRKPKVEDFQNLSDDVFTIKGFWRNKVTRILLVVALTNLGSVLGTAIGGADVIRLFIKNIIG